MAASQDSDAGAGLEAAITIAPLGSAHLIAARALSRQAGWPHRLEDWAFMLELSRGFAAIGPDGVVGTTLLTPLGAHCATINMVIVDQSLRGKGVGRRLMDAALAGAGQREIRLVSTADGRALYEKLGFSPVEPIHQHQGEVPLGIPADATSGAVFWAGEDDVPVLSTLDSVAYGADRGSLIATLCRIGKACLLKDGAGRTIGFAIIRAFGRGDVIGPVVAPDRAGAEALIAFLLAHHAGGFVRVDTGEMQGLSSWLAGKGLPRTGGGIAMRRLPPGAALPERGTAPGPTTFALVNQALG